MSSKNEEINKRITEIEALMVEPTFWQDKDKAQGVIAEYRKLKDELEGLSGHDKKGAIMTIFAGAGGDDAEDFVQMILSMYMRFSSKKGWGINVLDKNENDHGGYRSITTEINGKGAYKILKNEAGVHRLVRISPFNANSKRQTSFCLVEVLPQFDSQEIARNSYMSPDDVEIVFTKSGGPGGQNVNKRETAVRVVHKPTNIAVSVRTERSQGQNKEKALEILAAKLYNKAQEEQMKKERGMAISVTTDAEWGNQIRSYVLHPYKLVKDHRSGVEVRDPDSVLEGNIEPFLN